MFENHIHYYYSIESNYNIFFAYFLGGKLSTTFPMSQPFWVCVCPCISSLILVGHFPTPFLFHLGHFPSFLYDPRRTLKMFLSLK